MSPGKSLNSTKTQKWKIPRGTLDLADYLVSNPEMQSLCIEMHDTYNILEKDREERSKSKRGEFWVFQSKKLSV